MLESNISKLIMLAVSKIGTKIFRNNTGMAYQGKSKRKGDLLIIKNPRVLHAGLCEGSSDLIGWSPVEITEDMVGKKVAVFTAIEVKQKYKKATKEQRAFIARIKEDGGIAGVARSEKEAKSLIDKFKPQ